MKIPSKYQTLRFDYQGLVDEAKALAQDLGLTVVSKSHGGDTVRARLQPGGAIARSEMADLSGSVRSLRYYLMKGLVDKPLRKASWGKKESRIYFNARHLFQYLTIRRYLALNFGLKDIERLTATTTTVLYEILNAKPSDSVDEILEAVKNHDPTLYSTMDSWREEPDMPTNSNRDEAATNPILGMADLLSEVERTRNRFSVEIERLRESVEESGQWLNDIKRLISQSTQYGFTFQREFNDGMNEVMSSLKRLSNIENMLEEQRVLSRRLEERFNSLEKEQESRLWGFEISLEAKLEQLKSDHAAHLDDQRIQRREEALRMEEKLAEAIKYMTIRKA